MAAEDAKERIKSEREMRVIDSAEGRSIFSYMLFTDLRAIMTAEPSGRCSSRNGRQRPR